MNRSIIGVALALSLFLAPLAYAQTTPVPIGNPYTDTIQLWSDIASALSSLANSFASLFNSQKFAPTNSPSDSQRNPAGLAAAVASFNSAPQTASSATSSSTTTNATSDQTTLSQDVKSANIEPSGSQKIVASAPADATLAFDASDFVTQSELTQTLLALSNSLADKSAPTTGPVLPEWVAADGNPFVPYAAVSNIGQLSNVTITNANLSASEIPALDYLPLSGGTLTGTLSVPTLDASSTNYGVITSTNASSTNLSNFGMAYFGGTATSTFDSAGDLTLSGNASLPAGKTFDWTGGIGTLSTGYVSSDNALDFFTSSGGTKLLELLPNYQASGGPALKYPLGLTFTRGSASLADSVDLQITRNANYTGSQATGDNKALTVSTVTGTGVGKAEWNALFSMNTSGSANALAAYFQTTRTAGSSQVWGAVDEVIDAEAASSSVTDGSVEAEEFDLRAAGADNAVNASQIGGTGIRNVLYLSITRPMVGGSYSGSPEEVRAGIMFDGGGTAAKDDTQAHYDSLIATAVGTQAYAGMDMRGLAAPSGSTSSPIAMLMSANEPIEFDGDSNTIPSLHRALQYNSAASALQYINKDASTTLLTVTDNGNVGIDNSTPLYPLDVTGDANISGGSFYRISGQGILYASSTLSNLDIGFSAGAATTTTGTNDLAVGVSALSLQTSAQNNVALGNSALQKETSSGDNVAVGTNAGELTTGANGVYVGYAAGQNHAGSQNTIVGAQALQGNGSGADNTAVGYFSGQGDTSGGNNAFVGWEAASTTATGNNNIALGYDIDLPSVNGSNQLDIGNLVFGTSLSSTYAAAPAGDIGIGSTTPYARLSVWGADSASSTLAFNIVNSASTTVFSVFDGGNAELSGSLSQSSDQRLKTNIQSLDASSSLSFIDELNPVTFNWIDPNQTTVLQLGFIAQQVQEIFPNLVSTTSATALTPGGTLSLNYIGLISPIVSAIQELSSEIASIENTVASFAQSITSARGNFTDELCVGSTCVTPAQFQAMVAAAGAPQSWGQGSGGTPADDADATDTPPIIQINGDNPAIIQVGATYNDLGAAIIGPTADLNLGIQTYVNGASRSPVQIDTSQAATDTIDYVADQNGLTSTSTRTVIIEALSSPGNTASSSTTPDTSTIEATTTDTSATTQ